MRIVGCAVLAAAFTLIPAVHEPVAAQQGDLEVTVTTPPPLVRRTAGGVGYQGRGRGRPAQDVSPVVYLEGAIAGASVPAGSTIRMIQADTLFTPSTLFVPSGGSVDFPNEDPFYHNVFSYSSAQRFDLGRYSSGESKQVTFSTPGLVEVFCEVHRHMRALVVVVENPFYSEVGDDDRVRFAGVPPGSYELVVWHPDFRPARRTVDVTAGSTARVEVELSR